VVSDDEEESQRETGIGKTCGAPDPGLSIEELAVQPQEIVGITEACDCTRIFFNLAPNGCPPTEIWRRQLA
jgi:hypothetical protein